MAKLGKIKMVAKNNFPPLGDWQGLSMSKVIYLEAFPESFILLTIFFDVPLKILRAPAYINPKLTTWRREFQTNFYEADG